MNKTWEVVSTKVGDLAKRSGHTHDLQKPQWIAYLRAFARDFVGTPNHEPQVESIYSRITPKSGLAILAEER